MRPRFVLALFIATFVAASSQAVTTRFDRFDKNHSTIGFRVPILRGLSEVWGKFTDFSATIVWDEADPTKSSVDARIVVASVDTGIPERDEDLRSAHFFEVEKFPEIGFHSTSIEKRPAGLVAKGELSMHGVTKSVELPFEIVGLDEDAKTKKISLGVRATITLDRDDFGITWRHDYPPFVGEQVAIEIHLLTRLTERGAAAPSQPTP